MFDYDFASFFPVGVLSKHHSALSVLVQSCPPGSLDAWWTHPCAVLAIIGDKEQSTYSSTLNFLASLLPLHLLKPLMSQSGKLTWLPGSLAMRMEDHRNPKGNGDSCEFPTVICTGDTDDGHQDLSAGLEIGLHIQYAVAVLASIPEGIAAGRVSRPSNVSSCDCWCI